MKKKDIKTNEKTLKNAEKALKVTTKARAARWFWDNRELLTTEMFAISNSVTTKHGKTKKLFTKLNTTIGNWTVQLGKIMLSFKIEDDHHMLVFIGYTQSYMKINSGIVFRVTDLHYGVEVTMLEPLLYASICNDINLLGVEAPPSADPDSFYKLNVILKRLFKKYNLKKTIKNEFPRKK